MNECVELLGQVTNALGEAMGFLETQTAAFATVLDEEVIEAVRAVNPGKADKLRGLALITTITRDGLQNNEEPGEVVKKLLNVAKEYGI